MATQPLRPCPVTGCGALVAAGRCARHRKGSAHQRGYGQAWRGARRAKLDEEPWCRLCAAEGRVRLARPVDHIVPKVDGGTDASANLQPLCDECHENKSAREDAARKGRAIAREGGT
jgi:5-methylcytosine-specific restriction protein A